PQPCEGQGRIGTRCQHQLDRRRQVAEQVVDLAVAAALLDQVIVVKDKDDRPRERVELAHQDRQQGPAGVLGPLPQGLKHGLDAELGAGTVQGVGGVGPQADRVIVVRVEGDPREGTALVSTAPPLRYQRRLAVARWAVNEAQLATGAGGPRGERGPLHPPVARLGRAQLALERDIEGGICVCRRVNGPRPLLLRRPFPPVRFVPLCHTAQARIVTAGRRGGTEQDLTRRGWGGPASGLVWWWVRHVYKGRNTPWLT